MSNLNMDLGVLEHQMHQAHRNAVQAELSAAGLQEVGHPLLLCILRSAGERCPDGQAQRELAELLNISPPAVAASLKSLEKKGYIHREPEPGDARRNPGCRLTAQGGEGGGRLLRLPAAGDPQNVHRLYHRGAGSDAGLLSADAGEPPGSPGRRAGFSPCLRAGTMKRRACGWISRHFDHKLLKKPRKEDDRFASVVSDPPAGLQAAGGLVSHPHRGGGHL